MVRASFISSFSFSTVMPGRHCDSGFRLITVSNISRGAGSVAVSALPALPKTLCHLGDALQDLVLQLEEVRGHRYGGRRRGHGHIEEGAFVEGRHELGAELREGVYRDDQNDDGRNDDRFLEAQGKARHRLIDPVEKAAHGVLLLGPDLPPDEQGHEDGRQGHGEKRGEEHGEGLRVGEGLEEPSRLGLEREDREEADRDDEEGEEEGRPDLLAPRRDVSDVRSSFLPACPACLPFLQLLVGVLHHDDRGVDHGADGDGNAGEAHDVRGDPHVVHEDEAHDDGDGQREDDHQRARQVEEEDDADHAHRDGELEISSFSVAIERLIRSDRS